MSDQIISISVWVFLDIKGIGHFTNTIYERATQKMDIVMLQERAKRKEDWSLTNILMLVCQKL